MIPNFLRLNGVTRIDRHDMISRVKEAISKGGGYILDFHLFSNASICINFEVSAGNIEKLYASLTATGLRLQRWSFGCDLMLAAYRRIRQNERKMGHLAEVACE